MNSKIVGYGIGALALSGLLTLVIRGSIEEQRYIREHTFTETAEVVQDKLYDITLEASRYKVLTKEGNIIEMISRNNDELQDLDLKIGIGTIIEVTGYPDRTDPKKIHAFEINLPDYFVSKQIQSTNKKR